MKKLLFLLIFTVSCNLANNEQIYTCVQQCKAINAQATQSRMKNNDFTYTCYCQRKYQISPNGDNIQEVDQ